MGELTGPRFPVYIVSKSRANIARTPGVLDALGVPWRMIVEAEQLDAYAARYDPSRLLVLPESYQAGYEPLTVVEPGGSQGPGPARNYAWEHSMSEGHAWHWVLDDNIRAFARLNRNVKRYVGDGMIFAAMEDFATRYANVGAAGPEYWMFSPARAAQSKPFLLNRRIFSCLLLRNDTGLRWRGRWNEDLMLCIALLRAGWCTVTFRAFLQEKRNTQEFPGGNTAEFYAGEGTARKSLLAATQYPDIVRVVERYGRPHHVVDWSEFANLQLVRDPAWQAPAVNPYQTRTVDSGDGKGWGRQPKRRRESQGD